jgi:hypothetical protein
VAIDGHSQLHVAVAARTVRPKVVPCRWLHGPPRLGRSSFR